VFKLKRSVIRTAAASVGVAGLILAGSVLPAQAAGSHLLTVHVSTSNCPWGYGGGVKSVQLGVVPSSSINRYPVAGSAQTFTVPGRAQLFTIAGNITCGKSGWNIFGKAATNAYLIKYVNLTATQRHVYV
jgi:hypothetical protein